MRPVIARLAALLSDPPPVLSAGRTLSREPALPGDLPMAGVDLALDPPTAVGLGRIGHEGKTATRVTAVVIAGTDPGFSSDLAAWQIPDPLTRDATGEGITVAAGGTPLARVATPRGPEQFRLDPDHRRVVFGAPQPPGRILDIAYPALAFSDDIRFDRHAGTLGLTLWAAGPDALETLAAAAEVRLADRALARARGFLRLDPAGLEPAALRHLAPPAASPFATWSQRLTFRFTFEAETGGAATQGGRIRTVTTRFDGVEEAPLIVPAGP